MIFAYYNSDIIILLLTCVGECSEGELPFNICDKVNKSSKEKANLTNNSDSTPKIQNPIYKKTMHVKKMEQLEQKKNGKQWWWQYVTTEKEKRKEKEKSKKVRMEGVFPREKMREKGVML